MRYTVRIPIDIPANIAEYSRFIDETCLSQLRELYKAGAINVRYLNQAKMANIYSKDDWFEWAVTSGKKTKIFLMLKGYKIL